MDLATIKTALKMLGIKNLSVKFDPQAELIRTSFTYLGSRSEETISFQSIEDVLTGPPTKPTTNESGRYIDINDIPTDEPASPPAPIQGAIPTNSG